MVYLNILLSLYTFLILNQEILVGSLSGSTFKTDPLIEGSFTQQTDISGAVIKGSNLNAMNLQYSTMDDSKVSP